MIYLFIVMVAENALLTKFLAKSMFQGKETHISRFGVNLICFNIIILVVGCVCYLLSNINSYFTVLLFVSNAYQVFFAWVVIAIANIIIICGVANNIVENKKIKLLQPILIIAIVQTMFSLYKIISYLALS